MRSPQGGTYTPDALQFPSSFNFGIWSPPGCLDKEVHSEAHSESKKGKTCPKWGSFIIIISLLPLTRCALSASVKGGQCPVETGLRDSVLGSFFLSPSICMQDGAASGPHVKAM